MSEHTIGNEHLGAFVLRHATDRTSVEILKIVVPAAVALVGTVLTTIIAYRRWKREQEDARSGEYESQRQKAYSELWNMLVEVHIKLRVDAIDQPAFRTLVQEVTAYLLKSSLWLDKEDRRLATEYLHALYHFKEGVFALESEAARQSWIHTGELPADVAKDHGPLKALEADVTALEETLIKRFKSVLSGKHKLGDKAR